MKKGVKKISSGKKKSRPKSAARKKGVQAAKSGKGLNRKGALRAKKQIKNTAKKGKRPVKRSPTHKPATHKVEEMLRQEVLEHSKDMFEPGQKWKVSHWARKYSPVIVTLGVGLATYFYLVFYLFYPTTIISGHWFQLLLLLIFIFLLAGVFLYLGLRSELLFIRILSFIFVFIIFTFLLLFILLAHSLPKGG